MTSRSEITVTTEIECTVWYWTPNGMVSRPTDASTKGFCEFSEVERIVEHAQEMARRRGYDEATNDLMRAASR